MEISINCVVRISGSNNIFPRTVLLEKLISTFHCSEETAKKVIAHKDLIISGNYSEENADQYVDFLESIGISAKKEIFKIIDIKDFDEIINKEKSVIEMMDIEKEHDLLFSPSAELTRYNNIRMFYAELANEEASLFEKNYYTNFHSLDDIHEKCETIVFSSIEKAIKHAIQTLINEYHIVDIDSDEFMESYLSCVSTWTADFEVIDKKYLEIVYSAAELDAYRTARRENRGRWHVVRAHNVSGAISGAVNTAAMNAATGLLHGAFNMGAKAISAISDSIKKDEIFKDPNTKLHLVNAVRKLIFDAHLALINAINDKTADFIGIYPSRENKERAEKIINNIELGSVRNELLKGFLLHAAELNPYDPRIYHIWISHFSDRNNIIQKTATFFGVHEITAAKEHALLKLALASEYATETDLRKTKLKLADAAKDAGISLPEDVLSLISKKEEELKSSKMNSVIQNLGLDDVWELRDEHKGSIAALQGLSNANIDIMRHRRMKILLSPSKEVFSIIGHYGSNPNKNIYFADNLPANKMERFSMWAMQKFNAKISNNSILAYIDESLLANSFAGLICTRECLYGKFLTMSFEVKLADIVKFKISGLVNRTIDIKSKSGKQWQVILSQSNDGSEVFYDFVLNYMKIMRGGNSSA
nr:hypothetical protein [uncultured Ottowia sp.]